ncbi:MAG: beta-N-acetylhexosaminidase [Burkholderiales bacterium]|nr:beta-N-acetylhexosaminidase [Anaerolineae bacterium]
MQQLMYSFKGYVAPQAILDGVESGQITSFCLFTNQNIESPAQLRMLTDSLRDAAARGGHLPPLIGVDQEGGQLTAIANGATELPGNMALGATRSPELAYQYGLVLGRELLAMGVNLNFAPTMDVNVNPANPVIGIRSFGEEPELVADLGTAVIRGMQDEGILATAKHFPGHGDVASDPHDSQPVNIHPRSRLNTVELVPFRAAIRANVSAIMSGHILFTALDDRNPATLSSVILHDLLRNEMGFDGLVITDAMDMQAVARRGKLESVRDALQAGVDMVLLGHLTDQLELGQQTAHLENPLSVDRIQSMRQRIPAALPSLDVVGSAEHRQIAQTIAERSITLVKNGGQLPLRPSADDLIAVITPIPLDLTPADTSSHVTIQLAEFIQQRHSRTISLQFRQQAAEVEIRAIVEAAAKADIVIVGTIAADQDESQAALVRELHLRGKRPIVIALRTPYDLSVFPEIETYLCTYGIRGVTLQAATRVLFGEINAEGVLPCSIPGRVDYVPNL